MDTKIMKIVEVARELLKAQGYFVENLWHVGDVHFLCEQNDIPRLTDDEAMEVFRVAGEQFDGENGISWPQLEQALHTYLRRKAILQSLVESTRAEK